MEWSVLDRAVELLKENAQLLGKSIDALAAPPGATTRVAGSPASLLHWCRSTENTVVRRSLADARVFAGFEHLSRARHAAGRYRQVAATARALFVFGRPDRPLAFSTTATIEVESGPLLREWFLLVESDTYGGLLAARDLDGLQGPRAPRHRRFEGVVTHHPATIRTLAAEIYDAIESRIGDPARE